MLDEVVDASMNPYGVEQVADLDTGTLAELKRVVDAEVAKRVEEYGLLLPVKLKRNRTKKGK
jgi:RecJ-like exonuclease